MSESKTLDNEIDSNQQMIILQNRRMDEVRKNFAAGIPRIVAVKNLSRESSVNTCIENSE